MLSDKKKAFARGIVQGLSNKDAAEQAGYKGKDNATMSAIGSRLAKEKEIIDYIGQLLNVKEKLEDKGENVDVADLVPVGTTEQVKNYKKTKDPLAFLSDVMDNELEELGTRIEAAKIILPYFHAKKGDVGVKQGREDSARDIARGGGKFSTMKPPTQTVN